MNENIDFEKAQEKYRKSAESAEKPASASTGSGATEPRFDELSKRPFTLVDGEALYTDQRDGVAYQEHTVHIVENDDGTILPVITHNIIPSHASMTGHFDPPVIIQGREYHAITCYEFHPLILVKNESGQTTAMTELIDAELAQTCIYGHIVCAVHSYRFESTKDIVCVKHISHYRRSLLIRAKHNSNKDLANRFLQLVGLRGPIVKQHRG